MVWFYTIYSLFFKRRTTQKADPDSIKTPQPLEVETKHQTHPKNYDEPPATGHLDPCDVSPSTGVTISGAGDTALAETSPAVTPPAMTPPVMTSPEEPSPTVSSLTNELNDEKKLRAEAEKEVLELKDRLTAARMKWKQAARELDEARSQNQRFNQVTDDELKSMAEQLRYTIRNFAIQYFSKPPSPQQFVLKRHKYDAYLPSTPNSHRLYLKRPEHCPLLIERFIWRVLINHIFERFLWAGDFSPALDNLWYLLRYGKGDSPQTTPESAQKLHMWLATTAELIPSEKRLSVNLAKKQEVVHEIQLVLNPLSSETYDQELDDILGAAIIIDQVVSSQAAKVSWEFRKLSDEEYGKQVLSDRERLMVTCPAMVKQGKSNGEDFEVECVLLSSQGEVLRF
ncbi:hypothetical protein F4818DRAFT_430879 [Hypoxylon cercidicola]|nr:hypothetical protein F4818DRAFT_430879 [Hypoxylon cercidicola]